MDTSAFVAHRIGRALGNPSLGEQVANAPFGRPLSLRIAWEEPSYWTNNMCRQSSLLQKYIFDEKKIVCFVLTALCFRRFACPNKSAHKLAIHFFPFNLAERSQRSACSILGDIL